jgi:hypothetical protein
MPEDKAVKVWIKDMEFPVKIFKILFYVYCFKMEIFIDEGKMSE